jgi:hypothetical protein
MNIDHWVGKTLFIPIIIKVCQKAHVSQYIFASYSSASATMYWLWLFQGVAPWFFYAVMVLIAVFQVSIVALRIELAHGSQKLTRWMCLFFGTFDLVVLSAVTVFWALMLFAEYARTIDTIPPEEIKEPTRALVPAKRSQP